MTCHLIIKAVMKQNCVEALNQYYYYYYYFFLDPGTQFPRKEKITLCNIKKSTKIKLE